MRFNNLLRFDYWLDASVVNQPAGAMWLIVFAGVIGCAVVLTLFAQRRLPRDVAAAWAAASGLIGLVGLGRVFAIPVLGLRVGWLIAGIVVLAPIVRRLARDIQRDGLVRDCLDAMAFAPLDSQRQGDWHLSTVALWLGFHLVGAAVIFANINLPSLYAPLLLLIILAPVLIAFVIRATRHSPPQAACPCGRRSALATRHLSCLAPLTITYLTALLNLSGSRIEGALNGVLYVSLSLIVMSVYAFAISCRWSVAKAGLETESSGGIGDWRFVKGGAAVLVAATFIWAIWTGLTVRTYGVTGSDPYAYAQMGIDLATRSTVFHSFPLVATTYDLAISSFPIIHVGYKIPNDASRMAATVWPPGYAVFTALAYTLGGETGIYLITPLLNLVSLAMAGWFAWTVLRPACRVSSVERNTQYAVIALTVFFTATSYQQVEWQMIPMADIAAQLFSILAITLALRAGGSLILAALSGFALGIAFDIRYTQVLIAPAIALTLLLSGGRLSFVFRLSSFVACALAAFLAALPVLIYHAAAFGSPFHSGSEELTNFSLSRLPETLLSTLTELNYYREYRWLTPLIVIGVIVLWRRSRAVLAVLATYFIVLFTFHVAYAYLRLRDILFLFPVLNFLAALGTVELWRFISSVISRQSPIVSRLLSIVTICALSFLFVLRSMETLSLPVLRGFNSFGYLAPDQRQSFARLLAQTPPDAVIGSTLNSGAIDLYARRLTFRPANWQPDELTKFVDHLHEANTPVFLLDDGEDLKPSLQTLRKRYNLVEVERVDVPYYFKSSGSENRRVPLFRIEARK